jgi:hypothetical protein
MKLLSIGLILSLGACSLFESKPDAPQGPKEREAVIGTCPDYPACEGKYKSGVICEGGSHHSDAAHCPLKK